MKISILNELRRKHKSKMYFPERQIWLQNGQNCQQPRIADGFSPNLPIESPRIGHYPVCPGDAVSPVGLKRVGVHMYTIGEWLAVLLLLLSPVVADGYPKKSLFHYSWTPRRPRAPREPPGDSSAWLGDRFLGARYWEARSLGARPQRRAAAPMKATIFKIGTCACVVCAAHAVLL